MKCIKGALGKLEDLVGHTLPIESWEFGPACFGYREDLGVIIENPTSFGVSEEFVVDGG